MPITRQHAKSIVDGFRDRIGYGLSITDTRGIVLASTDSSRPETFHELAYTMVLSKKQTPIKVTNGSDYLGSRTGVCMVFHYEGEIAGAFAMTGDPEQLFQLAGLMQVAIENALQYESREQYSSVGRGFRESFISELMYNSHPHEHDLESWAEQLRFNPGLIRVPILFSFHNDEAKELFGVLKTALPEQDILAETRDGQYIIFKALSLSAGSLLGTYSDVVKRQYLQVCELLSPCGVKPECYVGSFQEQLAAYSQSCQHCFWLRRRFPNVPAPVFFYDHIEAYLFEQVPASEIYRVFNVISRYFDFKLVEDIGHIIGTLDKNNYNLVSSSKELFMHKNTLTSALERIKEYTDMQPMRSSAHRKFLRALSYYFEHIEGGAIATAAER